MEILQISENNRKEKLMKLAELVNCMSGDRKKEESIKKGMLDAGLKYSSDPLARLNMIMKELDLIESQSKEKPGNR